MPVKRGRFPGRRGSCPGPRAAAALVLALAAGPGLADPGAFGPLGDLAGRCFTGTLPNGHVDTHCYRRLYGGAFIRDRHVVTGGPRAYCGETVYAPARDQEPMRFWYWASSGDVSEGSVEVRDDTLVFPETVTTGTEAVEYRTTWRLSGDGYRSLMERREDGEWSVVWDIGFAPVQGVDAGRYAEFCEDTE